MYHLYILTCADGTLYTGITVDLKRRIIEHNSSALGAKYTRGRRPVKLLYSKAFRNRSLASKEEARIKKLTRKEKIDLAKNMKVNERNLESIPGVGKSIAKDLRDIGVDRPSCLKGKSPERLYEKLCKLRGQHIDRCMLYTFRCAVYYVNNKKHDSEKLKWWHWKDQK